jgi:hypothetical protein
MCIAAPEVLRIQAVRQFIPCWLLDFDHGAVHPVGKGWEVVAAKKDIVPFSSDCTSRNLQSIFRIKQQQKTSFAFH